MSAAANGRSFSCVAKELCEKLKIVQNLPRECLELVAELLVLHQEITEELVEAVKKTTKVEAKTKVEDKLASPTAKNSHALVITGIPEAPSGTHLAERLLLDKTSTATVLETGLNLECKVNDVRRMGKYENETRDNRPRPIKVTLHSAWNVRLALARAKTLREKSDYKNIYVNRLKTAEEMKRHRESKSINPKNPDEDETYVDADSTPKVKASGINTNVENEDTRPKRTRKPTTRAAQNIADKTKRPAYVKKQSTGN